MAKLLRDFVRVENDFTIIPNEILRNKQMKSSVKNILLTMLSLPPEWDFSIAGISACVSEGRDKVQKSLIELEKIGYITRKRERKPNGTLGAMIYTIHQFPVSEDKNTYKNNFSNQDTENPEQVNPTQANPILDSKAQLRTDNILNTYNGLNIDDKSRTDNNSFSEEKDIYNSPFQEMEKSVCKEFMPIRAGQIAYRMYKDEEMANNVKKFVDYFLKKRREKIGETHTPLKDTTLHRIIATITNPTEMYYAGKDYCTVCEPLISEFSDDSYKEIVDAYFEQKFKMKIDYSLPHFAQNTILTTLMMKVDKDKWCTNEQCGFMED